MTAHCRQHVGSVQWAATADHFSRPLLPSTCVHMVSIVSLCRCVVCVCVSVYVYVEASHTNAGSPHVRNLTLSHHLFHLFNINIRNYSENFSGKKKPF